MATDSTRLWIFNWRGGGYNCVRATTRAEALEKARAITRKLEVDEATLHEGTWQELAQLDKQYALLFD